MRTIDITGSESNKSMLGPLLIILLIISAIRVYLLSISTLDLFVDEIQYWWWSQELDWGFYSKPPMVAVLISLVTSMFGHSVTAVKLGSALIYPLTTCVVYLLGRKLVSEQVGFWAGVLFITLPGIALSSTVTSTDVLLLLFWSSAMLFFISSIETDRWYSWLACAVICGLGLLSKYNMAIFAVSALGYMVLFGHAQTLKNPKLWIMAAISLVILSPNIYWNYINDFPTFSHTAEYLDKEGLHPDKMFSFIFEQAGIIGPVGFILMWWWFIKGKEPKNLLLNFSLPMFIVICGVALQGRYNSNWAAPMYIGITIGIAHFLQDKKGWLIAMLATNLLLGFAVQLGDPILRAAGIELSQKHDPYKRVRGWKQWGEELQVYTDQYPNALLIVKGRNEITEATYYVFGEPSQRVVAWNPELHIRDHFQLTRPYTGNDEPALFLTSSNTAQVSQYFAEVELIATIKRRITKDKSHKSKLYKVDGFKGYNYASKSEE